MVPKVSTVSQIVAVLLCRFKVLPEMNEQKRTLKYLLKVTKDTLQNNNYLRQAIICSMRPAGTKLLLKMNSSLVVCVNINMK